MWKASEFPRRVSSPAGGMPTKSIYRLAVAESIVRHGRELFYDWRGTTPNPRPTWRHRCNLRCMHENRSHRIDGERIRQAGLTVDTSDFGGGLAGGYTAIMERKRDTSTKLPAITLAALKRQRIEECLADNDGNRTRAARELGVSTRTLQRKLKIWYAERKTRATTKNSR